MNSYETNAVQSAPVSTISQLESFNVSHPFKRTGMIFDLSGLSGLIKITDDYWFNWLQVKR